MALTITTVAEGPGKAGKRPLMFFGPQVAQAGVYTVAFDSSYPTGGESISDIFDDFKAVDAIFVVQTDITIADHRDFIVDLTNKKLIMLTAINTEATNASDQSAVTGVQLLVLGR